MKFEEVLPALREGYRARDKEWPKDEYIYIKDKFLYDQQGCLVHLSSFGLLAGDWEIMEEPESTYDWDYIIKNKCLCWFWDEEKNDYHCVSFLTCRRNDDTCPYEDKNATPWEHCLPVCKDEITFYEDREE